jgi:hypothetical protein
MNRPKIDQLFDARNGPGFMGRRIAVIAMELRDIEYFEEIVLVLVRKRRPCRV